MKSVLQLLAGAEGHTTGCRNLTQSGAVFCEPAVREEHAENDDQVFAWANRPASGHPGEAWDYRCTAEPFIDPQSIPEEAVCDILTGGRLSDVFPDADEDRLTQVAREIDLQIVRAQLNSPERLAHFFGQVLQEVG